MAPHEKVLVDRAFLEDANHGQIPCSGCHGGHPEAPGRGAAHEGIRKDPSFPDAGRVCGTCHAEIVENGRTSLHATLEPYRLAVEARAAPHPEVRDRLALAQQASCQSCHASCGQCHISQPTSVGGGFLAAHLLVKTPPARRVCTACHGTRVGNEFYGENEGVSADVHRLKRMECKDCHSGAELHGDGDAHASRYDAPGAPSCSQCHQAIYQPAAPNAETHIKHRAAATCQVCHAQSYKNCAACHLGQDAAGTAFFKTQPSWLGFKIGLNPIPSPRHPEKFSVLRHVPVDRETFDYYAKGALTAFDAVPTWKFATPHNIQRKTPQNAACNNCHGNAKLFLRAEDVEAQEAAANARVVVPEGKLPARWAEAPAGKGSVHGSGQSRAVGGAPGPLQVATLSKGVCHEPKNR